MSCECCREGSERKLLGTVTIGEEHVYVGVDPHLKRRNGDFGSYLSVQTLGHSSRLIPISYCPACGRDLRGDAE